MASKQQDDQFAEGLYQQNTEGEIARNESGGLKVMVVLQPAGNSREFEQLAARLVASSDAEIAFIGETGDVEIEPLTTTERRDLRGHFTEAEWAEIERMTK